MRTRLVGDMIGAGGAKIVLPQRIFVCLPHVEVCLTPKPQHIERGDRFT